MKRRTILLGCCLIAVFLTGCHKKADANILEDLNTSSIDSVTILALPPEKMIEVTDESNIDSVLKALKELPLIRKVGNDNPYNGQLLQFTLKQKKKDIVFSILSPLICINDTWYETDDTVCEQLNVLANRLLVP